MSVASVLFVDDEPLLGRALERYLTLEGFEMCWADRVDRALELATERPWDIIIADLDLGDMTRDGIDVVHAVRALRPDIVAIVISGRVMPPESGARRVDAAILKPIELAELTRLMRALIARSQLPNS